MFKKMLLAASAAGVLAACAGPDRWDVEAAAALSPQPPAFNQALHGEYTTLAATERARFDWCDTAYYVAKANAAATGETVLPTEVEARDLPSAFAAQAATERARLLAVLDGTARTSNPTVAATAQAAFDCWVEELEEGHQPADIAACRARYDEAMAILTAPPAAPAPEPAIATGPFLVFFESGSSRLDASARAVLAQAAEAYVAAGQVQVVIAGHTDTVGSADTNMLLSQRRAEAVADALALLNVPPRDMALEAYGEEQLRIPTGDGVGEARNRRVEITFRGAAR